MSVSMSKKQYLQTIFELSGPKQDLVANKSVAEHLHLTPASISEMATHLRQHGDIEVVPYHGMKLTDQGYETAMKLIRAHRILETFFVIHLKMSLAEAHKSADAFDHDASFDITNRLDAFLNFPSTNPSGLPIPNQDYQLPPHQFDVLSSVHEGDKFVITALADDYELLRFSETLHITINSKWRLSGHLSVDDGFYIQSLDNDQQQIGVTAKIAALIFVKTLPAIEQ